MSAIVWLANKHTLLVHLPVAAAILIPLPIIAAQRVGRGIRPWWVTCRYLAWAGLLGALAALVTGFLLGRANGMVPAGAYWGGAEPGLPYLFRVHELGGAVTFVLGIACLRSLYRKRQEHQGIGVVALLLGLLWSVVAALTSYSGAVLVGQAPAPALMIAPPQAAPPPAPAPVPAAVKAQDPESLAPLRALDFASLKPMHFEPVKSPAHGSRWIRVWVSPAAAEAYQAGQPLPPGALAVLSTLEDRWGRPGFDPGPLYALETGKDGKPSLTFYWPQVPEARRGETGGASRVYWRRDDAGLKACAECHAQGLGPVKDRSRWVIPRKPKTETAPEG